MEVTEQENGSGAVGKTRHLSISRKDTLVNDMKNSTPEGFVSMGCAVIALALIGVAVLYSYRSEGNAGYEIGIMALGAFLMGILAVLFGSLGKKNRDKIRHELEKRGIILGILICLALIALFVRGVIIYVT